MADPLALDVGAKASELELAPLSPYAGKYAGYAIERGKLSMDLHYSVQPDGRLEATNHVVLNQLAFGDRIESPSATKLPVRLAVALLSDRHGVIDVNLPISGSINDPNFSIGGVIWQAIANLIVKIVTSPFALFSGGGGEDLSTINFQPGTPVMVQHLERHARQGGQGAAGAADPADDGDRRGRSAERGRCDATGDARAAVDGAAAQRSAARRRGRQRPGGTCTR
jgi:hypothetical protein